MTVYFLITFIISIALAVCLFLWLIYRLQKNWTGQNKKSLAFLLPIIIALLFFFVVSFDTYPRLLDMVNILQHNMKTVQVSGQNIKLRNNRYIIEDKTYLTGFSKPDIDAAAEYSITYLPNTNIIVKQEIVKTLPNTEQQVPIVDDASD